MQAVLLVREDVTTLGATQATIGEMNQSQTNQVVVRSKDRYGVNVRRPPRLRGGEVDRG